MADPGKGLVDTGMRVSNCLWQICACYLRQCSTISFVIGWAILKIKHLILDDFIQLKTGSPNIDIARSTYKALCDIASQSALKTARTLPSFKKSDIYLRSLTRKKYWAPSTASRSMSPSEVTYKTSLARANSVLASYFSTFHFKFAFIYTGVDDKLMIFQHIDVSFTLVSSFAEVLLHCESIAEHDHMNHRINK